MISGNGIIPVSGEKCRFAGLYLRMIGMEVQPDLQGSNGEQIL
jgi:hypothetical protein